MNFSRFTSKTPSFVDHRVGDNTMRFYQNRVGLLQDLAEVAKPLVGALTVLFDKASHDVGATTERYSEGKSGDGGMERIIVEPISTEMAAFRAQQRKDAAEVIFEAITGPRERLLLGRCLMDSLRDELPYAKNRPTVDVERFFYGDGEEYHGLEGTILLEVLTGWAKANSKAFGKLGERMVGLVKEKVGTLHLVTDPTSGDASKTDSFEP